ncbi:FMN-binding glutamate synthase family protein [bacterium]|nr:FMN-binding glutamate synthase family protein [bacterium]
MSLSSPNVSPATLTKSRVKAAPISGICVTCLDGCPGLCEIGRSALRGRENLYPEPFGEVIAGSEKDYPNDFSHFNIQGTCVGAVGVEADSDKATFPAVNISTELGARDKIKLRFPAFTGAVGSTEIGRIHWEGMAIGAAISGIMVVAGENICGMDMAAEIKNGRVVRSAEMERRVKIFQKWHEGYGGIVVQANVEDTRLGVPEYVIEKLGVEIFELKWGQGAKDIGGEVKIPDLKKAIELKKRNYIVLPDPEDPVIQKAFNDGEFKEFERHSRLGMVDEEGFYKTVEHLRKVGAKHVTLKTGAYRPADLARAVKFSSEAKIDLLTVDGAGGGTGMSPWRMMNEWGIPTVQIECLLYNFLKRLDKKGKFIPDCAIAGGISLEDHMFKAFALGAPYIKAVCMGRSIMTAAMVGNTQANMLRKKMEKDIEKNGTVAHFFEEDESKKKAPIVKKGDWIDVSDLFVTSPKLKEKYGKDFKLIPPGALGVYTYIDRLTQGLQQLMAGERKFALKHIDRNDICALTREAAEMSGIAYVMDADKADVDRILG